MDLLRIGAHAINLDRVADIWDKDPDKVVVIFGDYHLDLQGDEASAIRSFVDQHVRCWPERGGPVKHTADLSGLEERAD